MATREEVQHELEHMSDEDLARLLHLIRSGQIHAAPDAEIRRADGLTDAEYDALLEELDSLPQPEHILPDEAFTRESIYGDHP